jgi:hypothetical protein
MLRGPRRWRAGRFRWSATISAAIGRAAATAGASAQSRHTRIAQHLACLHGRAVGLMNSARIRQGCGELAVRECASRFGTVLFAARAGPNSRRSMPCRFRGSPRRHRAGRGRTAAGHCVGGGNGCHRRRGTCRSSRRRGPPATVGCHLPTHVMQQEGTAAEAEPGSTRPSAPDRDCGIHRTARHAVRRGPLDGGTVAAAMPARSVRRRRWQAAAKDAGEQGGRPYDDAIRIPVRERGCRA